MQVFFAIGIPASFTILVSRVKDSGCPILSATCLRSIRSAEVLETVWRTMTPAR